MEFITEQQIFEQKTVFGPLIQASTREDAERIALTQGVTVIAEASDDGK